MRCPILSAVLSPYIQRVRKYNLSFLKKSLDNFVSSGEQNRGLPQGKFVPWRVKPVNSVAGQPSITYLQLFLFTVLMVSHRKYSVFTYVRE